jgi:hypothetical protein
MDSRQYVAQGDTGCLEENARPSLIEAMVFLF